MLDRPVAVKTLHSDLVREQSFRERFRREAMAVLAALAVSHEMGLVHRDIKPADVMTTRRSVVKVMDFTLCVSTGESTS